MGKVTGFMELDRVERDYQPVEDRIKHFKEFLIPLDQTKVSEQGARCMDCGIPYCHQGCPVNNLIPDWNDLIYNNKWKEALDLLQSTNNFPEFTGRICPAPCEASCTLNITDNPVAIKTIECSIVDKGWEEGWIKPIISNKKTGKKVAVIGSGPSGLACAQQLARAGHSVVVFEKNSRIGGLLRIGIPDFKMEKHLIDRRMSQMEAEGVEFRVNSHIGKNIKIEELNNDFDAAIVQYGDVNVDNELGTFDANSSILSELFFTPVPDTNIEMTILRHIVSFSDFVTFPASINFNNAELTTGVTILNQSSNVAFKKDFDLTHKEFPIFERRFNGSLDAEINSVGVDLDDDLIYLPNHYFVSGEKVSYRSQGAEFLKLTDTVASETATVGTSTVFVDSTFSVSIGDFFESPGTGKIPCVGV